MNSEHLDTLREIAEPVRSLRRAPRKVVEATILKICKEDFLTLDELADLLKEQEGLAPEPLHQSHAKS